MLLKTAKSIMKNESPFAIIQPVAHQVLDGQGTQMGAKQVAVLRYFCDAFGVTAGSFPAGYAGGRRNKNVEHPIDREELTLVTPDEKRIVEPGELILMAGYSSREENLLRASFRIVG
ncbi:MAG: hypothetical protein VB104_11520 [Candidatus Limiplasma sp.]|nr:hypothetical protein [Candidatus Limiplasma sp.]